MVDKDPYDDDEGFPENAEELFFIDENGNKTDEALHAAMGDEVADANFQAMVYRQAIDEGMDPELAHSLYMNVPK